MKCHFLIFGLFLGIDAFIVPDELPTLLSIVYSNIPVIKKGTDSRLGWGFSLGNKADFQVLVELGPQTNTQPLANQKTDTTNKRETLESLADTLYAQRQHEKKQKLIKEEKKQEKTDTEASNYLKNWSKDMNKENQEESNLNLNEFLKKLAKAKPGLGEGEIDAKSVIPDDEPKEKVSTESALDDVNLN